MSTPTVSCVVPVHNGQHHLAQALDSVQAQTCPPSQVIVVDDGSTDDTVAVIAEFGDRVTGVRQENRGPAAARNRGVAESDGEFVAFIDQDDLWHREKLERQLACFAADPALDLCFTHVQLFWAAEVRDEALAFLDHPRAGPVPGLSTPTLLARRSAFDRVGPLDPALRFADATDWTLRAIDEGLRMVVLPDVLLHHRMHDANLTREREASSTEFVRLVKATLDRRRQAAGGTA